MKLRIVFPLLLLVLLSCSKKPSEERRAVAQPSPGVPFQITPVETPEAKEQGEIKKQAIAFLDNKDYDKLEELAAKYRTSKECYADGIWKLLTAYDAVAAGDDLPSKEAWASRQTEIQEWVKAKPDSATARITLARFLRNYAWAARGNGWSSTVLDAGWQSFDDRLKQGWDVLDEAGNLKEQCPVYWSTRLGIALGLSVDKTQFNDIFSQAIKAEPDFQYYYRTRAVYLLPRWYGEEGEWEKDLAQSADRVGGEQGDMLYAQVVWDMHHYDNSTDVIEWKKISWERVNRGFAVILKQFPDSLAAKSERAFLAALAGDKANARKYLSETEGKMDPSIWDNKDAFIACANWAFAQ